ncbi:MAG TPA: hypothetical protein VFR67_08610 [Pilimelia sp.]|nr:hypothetical protein [Pilimelia sp.]
MKVAPTANYPVQVLRQEWEEDPSLGHLYAGAFAVSLNYLVHVSFIPDVSALAPPWDPDALTALMEMPQEVMSPAQAQVFAALSAPYIVTPNEPLAGTDEAFRWPADADDETAVFYVEPREFAGYSAELDALTEIVGDAYPDKRVADLRHYGVVAFLERRVVSSARLAPRHGVLLGRAG